MRQILIIGDSGSGKSTSIRSLDPATTVVIQPNKKILPFAGGEKNYNKDKMNKFYAGNFMHLREMLINISEKAKNVKVIIVDDLYHYILAKTMEDANKSGFGKFTQLATEFYNATIGVESELRDDLTIVYLTHSEVERDQNGIEKTTMKLSGKMISSSINPPSFFTYVLESKVLFENGKTSYKFLTNKRSEADLAKTPMGIFQDQYIDNDLDLVISEIIKGE